jgi:hypothetical protein
LASGSRTASVRPQGEGSARMAENDAKAVIAVSTGTVRCNLICYAEAAP